MALDLTGIGEGLQAAKDIVGKFFPDKTEVEKAQIASVVQMIQTQTNIDQAEAQSPDPLQHWRGGLGWICVLAYFNTFFLMPYATAFGLKLPPVDNSSLFTLTLGMLGLGTMHVYQTVKGA